MTHRCAAVLFKKILSICAHLQYQFEEGKVLALEIPEKIDQVVGDLQQLIDKYRNDQDGNSEPTAESQKDLQFYGDCILKKDPHFGSTTMYQNVHRAGELRKKESARDICEIQYGPVQFVKSATAKVQSIARNDIPGLMKLIENILNLLKVLSSNKCFG